MDDASGVAMRETIGFADDLRFAILQELDVHAEFNRIVICGMGASAIGGDVLVDVLAHSSDVPIDVIRSMDLPHWVGVGTLAIVCSYSGNTRETVSMYDQAIMRGCSVIVITAGGKLMERCAKDGGMLVQLSGGRQPRNALGMILGCMANVIETVGGAVSKKEMLEMLPRLCEFRDSIGFGRPDNYAEIIAKGIYGCVPVIYSTSGIAASATRWKTQLNETSKMMAFSGAMPEFTDIPGSSDDIAKFNCKPVFLCETEAPEIVKDIARKSINMFRKFNIDPVIVKIPGKTVMERSLISIMLGDHVSLCLAMMKNIDPIEVRSITELKKNVTKELTKRYGVME
jgi:Glucose-6-phosphate isomerase